MNKKAILAVADAIERASVEGLGFNMKTFGQNGGFLKDHTGHKCGTVACIAGWASVVLRAQDVSRIAAPFSNWRLEKAATDALDLSFHESDSLFRPSVDNWGDITTAQAVICLRNLAATGNVKWVDAMRGIKHYSEKLPEPKTEGPVPLSKTPHKVLEFA